MLEIISRADASRAGLKRYFTGKLCRSGKHVAEHYVSGGCAECMAARNATPKGRAARAAWAASAKGKATLAAYSASPAGRASDARRLANPEKRAKIYERNAAYRASLEGKAAQKEYLSRPEVIARKREQRLAYYASPAGKANLRRSRLKKKYGITPQEWGDIFVQQGSSCASCKTADPGSASGWHTDHCHTTGKVRGILCHHCNAALGQVNDSISTLEALIKYLNKHRYKDHHALHS